MLQLALAIIALQMLVLLLLRPLILWYLGLSRMTKILASIDESLSYLPGVMSDRIKRNRPPAYLSLWQEAGWRNAREVKNRPPRFAA